MSSAHSTTPATVTLWRPTGPEELELIRNSGWSAWPPRLPDQPIFYPVLNEDYAVRIARDWNVKASGEGHVTRFNVRLSFLAEFEVKQVGGQTILEYWIPAERLDELNANIIGTIDVVRSFRKSDRAENGVVEFPYDTTNHPPKEMEALKTLLAKHRDKPFPKSVERGLDYGKVDAVLIDADIFGWTTRVERGELLSELEQLRFEAGAKELAESIAAFPLTARPYFESLPEIATLALKRSR